MTFRDNFLDKTLFLRPPTCMQPRFVGLVSKEAALGIWLPLIAISLVHYVTHPEHHWVHDLLRRAYYLPIVIASIRIGLLGALATSAAVTLAYIPHAFIHPTRFDPADGLEKILEILLYFIVASVAGYLSDLECRRRYQLEIALEKHRLLTKQLVRAGRLAALGEVVAGIAHEIKNPLHSLSGTAEIVDAVVPKETEIGRMWEIHKEELNRLSKVSEQFLSFARPSQVENTLVDLSEVAHRLIDLVGADARQKNIDIESTLPEKVALVTGDLDQLAQVALNIAVNGIKAIGEKDGKLNIVVGIKDHNGKKMSFLRIENNGPKINTKELEHLFDPFHSSTGGSGLGLSISARIADQHDGYIEVGEGELGVAFTLYLPSSNDSA
jgi:signal transduction histidine kinase